MSNITKKEKARNKLANLGLKPKNHPLYEYNPTFYEVYYWSELFQNSLEEKNWEICENIMRAKYGASYVSGLLVNPGFGIIKLLRQGAPWNLIRSVYSHRKVNILIFFIISSIPLLSISIIYIFIFTHLKGQ